MKVGVLAEMARRFSGDI